MEIIVKVTPKCSLCLIERTLKISQFLDISNEKWFLLWKKILDLMKTELNKDSVPALISTQRELLIQEELNLKDPYEKIKKKSHRIGQKVAKKIERTFDMTSFTFRQFHTLSIYAAQANSMEWFIRGHKPNLTKFLQTLKKGKTITGIDETKTLWKTLQKAEKILYLLDNAGESEIDYLLLKFLRNMGKTLYIGAKSHPILNDITIKEARSLGFKNLGCLIPTGQMVGTLFDQRAPPELKNSFETVDLIIAKGMGSYETLSEYNSLSKPCFIALKAKCQPIADHLGIKLGNLVIKRLF